MSREHEVIRQEFERAAPTFSARTAGRFDHMDVVGFAELAGHETVAEIGVGTGSFLALFEGHAARLIGVDLTAGMLDEAHQAHPHMELVAGDGAALPLRSASIDLVTSAQALHHIRTPVPVLKEMRRVTMQDGRVLVVDQVATEHAEEALAMNELDVLRDPSHAMCRPPSAFRIMVRAAGLEIEDERIVESEERLSRWMTPDEFPEDRVDAVRRFVAQRGSETGMEWRPDGDDWVYVRRRIMLRARRA
ncbi:MAG: class I SAM-dependent methyltransferase [Actinomycetota bacterium]